MKRLLIFVAVCALFVMAYKFGQSTSTVAGEDIKPPIVQTIDTEVKRQVGEAKEVIPEIEVLSWKPRVFLYHGFISDDFCDHIIEMGSPEMSKIEGRTEVQGSGGYIIKGQKDHVLVEIEKKIAFWTMLPEDHGEVFYLRKFESGEGYDPHVDYFKGEDAEKYVGAQGQRMASVEIFLSTPEEGGEIEFPDVGIKIKPKKGSALLYYNIIADGKVEPLSAHFDHKVKSGAKYAIIKWLRQNKASRPDVV